MSTSRERHFIGDTYFRVLELLFDIIDKTSAHLADEATEEEFGTNFACPSNRSADTHELTNPVRSEVANAGHKRKTVECDTELARLQVDRVCGGSGRVELEVLRLELSHKVLNSASNVGEETVVLRTDRVRKHVVFLHEVAIVDIEGG